MARPRKDKNKEVSIILSDLIKNNADISDIGVILGALGSDSAKWLKDLKKECTTVEEFIELARQRADVALVAAAVEAAVGYDYEEVDIDTIKTLQGYDSNSEPILVDKERGRKIKKRRSKQNDALLKFILKNRLPEYFQDVSKVEINKKSIEIKEITAKEIQQFAGRLLDTLEDKQEKETDK